jgi:hypothetical protein
MPARQKNRGKRASYPRSRRTNLSSHGCCCAVDEPLAAGESVACILRFPLRHDPRISQALRCQAQVVWVRVMDDGRFGIGCRIDDYTRSCLNGAFLCPFFRMLAGGPASCRAPGLPPEPGFRLPGTPLRKLARIPHRRLNQECLMVWRDTPESPARGFGVQAHRESLS